MASSSNSSVSSQCGVTSPRRSPIARIRHARIVHNQLREWQKPSRIRLRQEGVAMVPPRSDLPADGIDRLARELLELRRQSPSEVAAQINKIGSHEKDTLILHLLDQVTFLHSQRDDVVAVGEQLTTQLAHQQHDLRVQFQAKTTRLQQQLDQAVHHHPQVTRLEQTIAELHQTNTELEQQLLFAAKKLHRSRQRERALRMEQENDPLLWNL